MSIDDFKNTTPVFLPETFFDGELDAWGVIESPVGGLQRRAVIEAQGQWDAAAQVVRLTETYRFDDGHTDTLRWEIRKDGPGRYSGSEPRLEGRAEGEAAGCAFHWSYMRDTPQADGGSTKLNFDDWFYMIDAGVCIVRGTAGRLGLPFATAHVTYRKRA